MKFISFKNPDAEKCFEIIEKGISKKALLIINACCRIFYEGRAKSRLGWGDRTIILKGDGSFLIHQDRNLEPVNWQPPKSKLKVKIQDKKVFIQGSRRNPPESLKVEIDKTYLASYFQGKDTRSLELVGYESDMGDMIFQNPEIIEEGFRPTSREYSTENGFIDILGKDKRGNLMVLELKSRRAGVNAVKQLQRYLTCFSHHKRTVRGILVAPSLTDDALDLLKEKKMEFISLEPPKELKNQQLLTLEDF